jgi:hypothetical protein
VHAASGEPSREHWYVTPGWSAEKLKVALVSIVVAGSAGLFDVIVVSGGPTTVQV